MPWQASDAPEHNAKASTPRLSRLWAATANHALEKYGDEGRAIRIANGAVKRAIEGRPHATDQSG